MTRTNKRPDRAGSGAKLSALWLAMIDIALTAAGVGLFYLYLTALPQAYAVVEVTPRAASAPTLLPAPTVALATDNPATDAPVTVALPASSTPSPTAAPSSSGRASAAGAALLRATATPRVAPASTPTSAATATPTSAPTLPRTPPAMSAAPITPATLPAGKFTAGEVIRTGNEYRSANINVTLTRTQRNGVTFYVQDIYVRSVEYLRSAFARNTYGRAIAESALSIANANNAIGAINGDYYGTGTIGVVIRNGELFNGRPDGDVCVLFKDGTMKTYAARDFNADAVMAGGAWQAWSFGPSLITAEGKALGVFDSGIAGHNPRTAIGYVAPGHYLFVVVDGRQPGYSNGMTLAQLAALFEELGAQVAYNLDGGQTSVMTFGGQVVSQPYRGGRNTSDIIYVAE